MSRNKGAYLDFRKESYKADGSLRNKAGYYIRDGGRQISIGSGITDIREAQEKFDAYRAEQRAQPRQKDGDPAQVKIVDVLSFYGKTKCIEGKMVRWEETLTRLENLSLYIGGDMTVSQINGDYCRKYADATDKKVYARHHLEDLRAALNHYRKEGYITSVPGIVLPDKPEPRERWLTRSEAAKLILTAWRMRQTWKGQASDRRTGKHLARYLLVALYTGTRSGAVCGAAIRPTPGSAYVDLDNGVYYRRPAGKKETKKRQPPIRLPDRLMVHLRRWRDCAADPINDPNGPRISQNYLVEWNGEPVLSVKKSFRSACDKAGLGEEVIPHTLRHTTATWLMQAGTDPYQAAGFLGMTYEVLMDVYGHHHPDFQADAANAISRKRSEKKAAPSNVVPLNVRKAS